MDELFLSRDLAAIIYFSDKNKTIVRKFCLYIFRLFLVDLYANLYLYLKKKTCCLSIIIFK